MKFKILLSVLIIVAFGMTACTDKKDDEFCKLVKDFNEKERTRSKSVGIMQDGDATITELYACGYQSGSSSMAPATPIFLR